MNMPRLRRSDPYGLLVFLLGLLVMAEAFLRHVPETIEAVIPFIPESTSRRALFIIGILLLYLSEQVARRKRIAWVVTTSALALLVIITITHHFALPLLASYVAVLFLFILERKAFVVRSDTTSLRRGITRALVQVGLAVVLVGIIFTILDQREFGRHLTSLQTLHYTTDALFGRLPPHTIGYTRYDDALIDMLRYTGLAALLLAIWNLFRPLRLTSSASRANRMLARKYLALHGDNSEDYFKLYPRDKHYFFYGESFVAYAVRNGVALVLDNACTAPGSGRTVRQMFLDYCRTNGWQVAVVHCDDAEAAAWRKLGLDVLQIGSEAIIDSNEFIETTLHDKHFRYVQNRAAKDGLQATLWEPPLSSEQLQQLKHISDDWLANGRQEYAFVMAPFTPEYVRSCQVVVLHGAEEAPIAYTTILPRFGQVSTASIDHMRSVPGVSSVTMHFLLARTIELTHEQDCTQFNLGFVPLAKLETDSMKLTNRLLATLRRVGARFYSSEGLEQFKGKFDPEWSPRFLAYQGGMRQLPVTAAALRQAVTYKTTKARSWNWPVILMALSGLLYASFPFAVFLNPSYAWTGLTSALGSSGQPYAWFFNGGDIVSSIIAIAVLAWLYVEKRPTSSALRRSLIFAFIGVVGAFIAAVVAMPDDADTLNGQISLSLLKYPEVIVHGAASFINSGAFVVGAIYWAYHWKQAHGKHEWQSYFAAAVLGLSTIGFVCGQLLPSTAGTIQRVFIVLYAIWYVLLTHDISQPHTKK